MLIFLCEQGGCDNGGMFAVRRAARSYRILQKMQTQVWQGIVCFISGDGRGPGLAGYSCLDLKIKREEMGNFFYIDLES